MTLGDMARANGNPIRDSIADVEITMGRDVREARLESSDNMALVIAVCTFIHNGGTFISGGDDYAIIRRDR